MSSKFRQVGGKHPRSGCSLSPKSSPPHKKRRIASDYKQTINIPSNNKNDIINRQLFDCKVLLTDFMQRPDVVTLNDLGAVCLNLQYDKYLTAEAFAIDVRSVLNKHKSSIWTENLLEVFNNKYTKISNMNSNKNEKSMDSINKNNSNNAINTQSVNSMNRNGETFEVSLNNILEKHHRTKQENDNLKKKNIDLNAKYIQSKQASHQNTVNYMHRVKAMNVTLKCQRQRISELDQEADELREGRDSAQNKNDELKEKLKACHKRMNRMKQEIQETNDKLERETIELRKKCQEQLGDIKLLKVTSEEMNIMSLDELGYFLLNTVKIFDGTSEKINILNLTELAELEHALNEGIKSVLYAREKLGESRLCLVCTVREANVVYVDGCNHLNVCETCEKGSSKQCPRCSAKYSQIKIMDV